jgi:APA family basic amino acid/polyamine antiporter
MVGTGVFTTLGFQAAALPSAIPILLLWLTGGILALCGALCYGELAVVMPRSGGEYNYLSRLYHPALGFLAGWVSATVGFAAPAALAAVAFGKYLSRAIPGVPPVLSASILILVVTLVHVGGIRVGGWFQNLVTGLNVALILSLIGCGLFVPGRAEDLRWLSTADLGMVLTPAFAVSLIYVMFAYSGWNGAIYVAGEVRNPGRNLPLSLFLGTLIVVGLYLGLNYAFLRTVPLEELAGKIEVAFLSAERIFSQSGAMLMSGVICVSLAASTSAFILAGSRVAKTIGEDYAAFRAISRLNRQDAPVTALAIEAGIALALILTSTFESVLVFLGFTLSLCTTLTVLSLFVLRRRGESTRAHYRTWLYPATPLVFLALSLWMLTYSLLNKPVESMYGLATAAAGLVLYFIVRRN